MLKAKQTLARTLVILKAENMTFNSSFSIVLPIKLLQPVNEQGITLPFLETLQTQQSYQLLALGGSGSHEWLTDDISIADSS